MQDKEVKAKNILKVMANLVFYTIIYFVYVYFFRDSVIGKLPLDEALLTIFNKPVFFHLWFFYQLLICYVFFVLISVKSLSYKKLIFFTSIAFLCLNAKTASYSSLFFGVNYYGFFVINDDLPFYILYAAIGASLGKNHVNPEYRNVYVVGFLILSSVTAYLTFLVSVNKNVFAQSFYYYSSILVMWASVLIFMYIKSFNCSVVGKWTGKIAVVSLPIYGVHPLILELFITKNLRISNVLLDILLITLIAFFISMFIGFGINKIDRKRWLS